MSIYVCYCLLKGSVGNRGMARRLCELQEFYESAVEPKNLKQAFVYGDKEVTCLPFKSYSKGWRTGLDSHMAPCRTQDMLALSWRLLESEMRRHQNDTFQLVLLADSPVEEEDSVIIVKEQLRKLKAERLKLVFVACSEEAYSGILQDLVDVEIYDGGNVAEKMSALVD